LDAMYVVKHMLYLTLQVLTFVSMPVVLKNLNEFCNSHKFPGRHYSRCDPQSDLILWTSSALSSKETKWVLQALV